jgi:hypothetical protein
VDQIQIDRELLQRLTRLETKMDMIISVNDTAIEALQSTKSAHRRIDDIEKGIEGIPNTVVVTKDRVDRLDKYLFFATTTGIFGFIGLCISIYSLFKGMK